MEDLNILYNFKNPIRHFFNINNVKFNASENLQFKDLVWTLPIKFNIYKSETETRCIGFPNILNFYHAVKNFENEINFSSIKNISNKKRVNPDLITGEFSVLSYYESIQKDLFYLTKYDKLLILDIKSFYGRIYTHDFKIEDEKVRRITSLNNGRTNGILLGSYLSLFIAEKFLFEIEKNLDYQLQENNIDCHYEYFSDDFYFFCNNNDIEKITTIFEEVLNQYDLQINYEKKIIYDFEEYSKNNNLEKLWKKIINISIENDRKAELQRRGEKEYLGHPAFFTQLVYRLGQITEIKYKRIFLANFFKTYYFNELKPELYTLSDSDFNYVCYIYKLMPETIIYSLPKIKEINNFNAIKFKDFLNTRFAVSLKNKKFEDQVYFYYAMKICDFDEELKKLKEEVVHTGNQILISYYLIDKFISKEEYNNFFPNKREQDWLQNYHYILTYDKDNLELLIPDHAKDNDNKKKSYYDFYKENLDNNISFLRSIDQVETAVDEFIELKIHSYNKQ